MNVFLNKTKQTFALIPWWFIEASELESGLFHDSVDEREAFFITGITKFQNLEMKRVKQMKAKYTEYTVLLVHRVREVNTVNINYILKYDTLNTRLFLHIRIPENTSTHSGQHYFQ